MNFQGIDLVESGFIRSQPPVVQPQLSTHLPPSEDPQEAAQAMDFKGISMVQSGIMHRSRPRVVEPQLPADVRPPQDLQSRVEISKEPEPEKAKSSTAATTEDKSNTNIAELLLDRFKIQISIRGELLYIEAQEFEVLKFYSKAINNEAILKSTGGLFTTVEELYEVLIDAMSGAFEDLGLAINNDVEIELWNASVKVSTGFRKRTVMKVKLEEQALSPLEVGERLLKDLSRVKKEPLTDFEAQLIKVLEKVMEQGKIFTNEVNRLEEAIQAVENKNKEKK